MALLTSNLDDLRGHTRRAEELIALGVTDNALSAAKKAIKLLEGATESLKKSYEGGPISKRLVEDLVHQVMYGLENLKIAEIGRVRDTIRTGAKTRAGVNKGIRRKRESAEHARTDWQSQADKIWAEEPTLSASKVAVRIDKGRAGYIRKKIKRPEI